MPSDYREYIGIVVWLPVIVACLAVAYMLLLVADAAARQRSRTAARIMAARLPICIVRDLAQTLHGTTSGDVDIAHVPGFTERAVRDALEQVLAIRIARMPTPLATEAAAKGREAAGRLSDWIDRADGRPSLDNIQILAIWRTLADACVALEQESSRTLRLRRPRRSRGRSAPEQWSRAAGRVGSGADDMLVCVRDLARENSQVMITPEAFAAHLEAQGSEAVQARRHLH